MSEYQYYEFQAIDRPLTKAEMAELRALSTRATITDTRFTNVYHYGDFRGDPLTLMERYFDAIVYVANWGTRRLMFRLPRRLLDPKAMPRYWVPYCLEAHMKGEHVILEFTSEEEEPAGWEEGAGWLASLIPLRADIASGDLRALYLGWLLCAQNVELGDEEVEPPVPPGLGRLSAPLRSLVEFVRIDEDLVAVGAAASVDLEEKQLSMRDLERWIQGLPDDEKNAILLRLLEGNTPHLRTELLRQLRGVNATGGASEGGRTVSELLAAAEEHAAARRRRQAEREARERAKREREQAAARAAYLQDLAGRQEEVWRQVEALVETKRPKEYDQAAQLLVDLRDLSVQDETSGAFAARLSGFRTQHAKKPAFLSRLDRVGLPRS